jgi:hypothetical protein
MLSMAGKGNDNRFSTMIHDFQIEAVKGKSPAKKRVQEPFSFK